MGVLVLNSSSFSNNYEFLRDFCEETKDSFKLILTMSKRGYIVYKDLYIDELELIKGVMYKDIFLEINKSNIDSELKRQLLSSISKISSDDSVFEVYEETIAEYPTSIFCSEDCGISLGYLNNYSLFSIDKKKEFCEYKLYVKVNNKSQLIYNAFDEKSFNTIALIEQNQSLFEYFNYSVRCVTYNGTDLNAFDNLLKDQQLVVIDRLYFELDELTKATRNLPYNRIDSLKGLIPGGFEYRLHLNSNTAYRIYYHINNGKVGIITDSNKKDNSITTLVEKRIQRIFNSLNL